MPRNDTLLSNFKRCDADPWGRDTVATRGAEVDSTTQPTPSVLRVSSSEELEKEETLNLERLLSQILEEDSLLKASTNNGADAADAVAGADADRAAAPCRRNLTQQLTLPLTPGGKLNAASAWSCLWGQLEAQGWRLEFGPRGDEQQAASSTRRRPGAACGASWRLKGGGWSSDHAATSSRCTTCRLVCSAGRHSGTAPTTSTPSSWWFDISCAGASWSLRCQRTTDHKTHPQARLAGCRSKHERAAQHVRAP
eukprot:TRINITY_DN22145_c0_g1_i6.p1 TRINITY_DN22145_c0_g1~~TRINITY_DN22145_c0_g1_i6.p1  ORF type:complete len:253 (+),score=41.70 TRINITY_DN22145_c0_g1_i6:572-1330(+)